MIHKPIPFNRPYLNNCEEEAVIDVLRKGWVTQGPRTIEFEKEFARWIGAPYAVAVNSCTAALFLSLVGLKLKPKARVAVPSLTFTASAEVIVQAGYTPVFVDVNPQTYCIDEDDIDKVKVDAVVSVHLTGNLSIQKANVPVIEDSAHRINRNSYRGNPTCFSFYATKNMTTGEGGMIATHDEKLVEWLNKARRHGMSKDAWKRMSTSQWEYVIEFCGWKANTTDIQAAIGIEQLKKLDYMNELRQRIIDRYNKGFCLRRTGLHLYPIRVNDRDKFMQIMKEKGIGCSVHFLALHKMPAYRKWNTRKLPVTEELSRQFVSLPLFPGMTMEEVDYVIEEVRKTRLRRPE